MLEIGCGKGEFIDLLDQLNALDSALGFDPSATPRNDGSIRIVSNYFSSETMSEVPATVNVVCSRHTIEHISDPRRFIAPIAELVRARKLRLFLETPDVSWILDHVAFEDFFYEHCSLFSPASMARLLSEFGLTCRTESVYNGQYMWTEAWPATERHADLPHVLEKGAAFRAHYEAEIGSWRQKTAELSQKGPLAIWGAASKGVTFALLMDKVSYAIDLNEAKQNCFLPVSGKPILSPAAARETGVRSIIIMNPNYAEEIRQLTRSMDWDVELLDLHNQDQANQEWPSLSTCLPTSGDLPSVMPPILPLAPASPSSSSMNRP
ncbi:class I SAM-dependent methyltransferase [Rhizobium paknamense]